MTQLRDLANYTELLRVRYMSGFSSIFDRRARNEQKTLQIVMSPHGVG